MSLLPRTTLHSDSEQTRLMDIGSIMNIGMEHEHGHEHAAWTWTCSGDMGVQHGHGHAAWTWICRMDMDMQHGHGRAAWTWTWFSLCMTYNTIVSHRRIPLKLVGHLNNNCTVLGKTTYCNMELISYSVIMVSQVSRKTAHKNILIFVAY